MENLLKDLGSEQLEKLFSLARLYMLNHKSISEYKETIHFLDNITVELASRGEIISLR